MGLVFFAGNNIGANQGPVGKGKHTFISKLALVIGYQRYHINTEHGLDLFKIGEAALGF